MLRELGEELNTGTATDLLYGECWRRARGYFWGMHGNERCSFLRVADVHKHR